MIKLLLLVAIVFLALPLRMANTRYKRRGGRRRRR